MVVDDIRLKDVGGRLLRSARFRSRKGEFRLAVGVPRDFAADPADATPFLPVALLLAMRVAEDLRLEGPVSRRLLEATERLQRTYHSWDVSLRAAQVEAESCEALPRGTGSGCFFSRGVDSLYAAARRTAAAGELTHLVFCTTLEPIHDEQVRGEEERLADESASRLGLPLVLTTTNIRALTGNLIGWGDLSGAGLAMLALSLAGGMRRMVVPSTLDVRSLGAWGSHPMLDPLFSTEAVEIEHDWIDRGRLGKIGWLVENRPDLLPCLKVCFHANRPDNCGHCQKCTLTMACLRAHGALEQATSFPDELLIGDVARARMVAGQVRIWWNEVYWALDEDDPLRGAIRQGLQRSTHPTPRQLFSAWRAQLLRRPVPLPPPWSISSEGFTRHETNSRIALYARGRPYP